MTLRRLAFRLAPDADLRAAIVAACRKRGSRSASIATCVGSLRSARIRFAGAEEIMSLDGPLEIVSLVGTVAVDGAHLHIAVADAEGRVRGGHLAFGSPVFTTAEVVVLDDSSVAFVRAHDARTGYRELAVRSRLPMRRRRISR